MEDVREHRAPPDRIEGLAVCDHEVIGALQDLALCALCRNDRESLVQSVMGVPRLARSILHLPSNAT
eukprot:2556151-Lingulodinium_polyedra.AAC.1